MKLSLCIPYHDTPNTAFYLSRMLKTIEQQTFRDFEIVLTKEGNFARNHNAALMKAKGDIVQFIQMDDYLSGPYSLQNIMDSIGDKVWQVTACLHDNDGVIDNPHVPEWTNDIYTGNNRLGSVSTLSMRRDSMLLFEEPLQWLVDCDLYYRMYLKYGPPVINSDHGLVIAERSDRLTNTIAMDIKNQEFNYLMSKYAHK